MKMGLDDILRALSLLMLERYVLFLSKDISLLNAVINFLLDIMSPFKYLFKVVPILPPS